MNTAAHPTPLLTIPEVVAYSRASSKSVRRAIARDELKAYKLAGKWVCYLADVDAWITREPATPGEPARAKLSDMLAAVS